jgi:hypothetical protein
LLISIAVSLRHRSGAIGYPRIPTRDGLDYLDLFAGTGVLDKVPDVDDALVADVGALEAGVMRLYGVVVILGRWGRVGCCVEGIAGWRYSVLVHSL